MNLLSIDRVLPCFLPGLHSLTPCCMNCSSVYECSTCMCGVSCDRLLIINNTADRKSMCTYHSPPDAFFKSTSKDSRSEHTLPGAKRSLILCSRFGCKFYLLLSSVGPFESRNAKANLIALSGIRGRAG
jgi:hypothetical protein